MQDLFFLSCFYHFFYIFVAKTSLFSEYVVQGNAYGRDGLKLRTQGLDSSTAWQVKFSILYERGVINDFRWRRFLIRNIILDSTASALVCLYGKISAFTVARATYLLLFLSVGPEASRIFSAPFQRNGFAQKIPALFYVISGDRRHREDA